MIKILIKKIIKFFSNLKQKILKNNLEGQNIIALTTKIRKSKIGFATYIGKNGEIYNTEIKRYTSIGPNFKTIIGTHPVHFVSTSPCFYSLKMQCGFSFIKEQKFLEETLKTTIGNDVWIGSDVKIIGGINIGDGVVIGAGSLVTKDIPSYEIWAGIPAKKIKDRFSKEQKEKLLKIQWWNKDFIWLKKNATYFESINKFIERCEKNK
ncbi:MAG: CatB-related O-acetyltransferase [Cetobacterium sp.]